MIKIFTISFIGVLAALVMLFGIYVDKDNPHHINVPTAAYGKCIYLCDAVLNVTIDSTGNVYDRKEPITLDQLEEIIRINNISNVLLRVDQDCKFGDLQPILSVLNKPEITLTTFRVAEE